MGHVENALGQKFVITREINRIRARAPESVHTSFWLG